MGVLITILQAAGWMVLVVIIVAIVQVVRDLIQHRPWDAACDRRFVRQRRRATLSNHAGQYAVRPGAMRRAAAQPVRRSTGQVSSHQL